MFDISFSEILVIAVVAVVVIGPERLPKTVRTLGHLFGRAQRYVNEVKTDIQREMEMEELRKMQQSVKDVGKDIEQSLQSTVNEAEKTARSAEDSVRQVGTEWARATEDATPHVATPEAAVQQEGSGHAATPTSSPVPASLQGEVELNIPGALPTSNKKLSGE